MLPPFSVPVYQPLPYALSNLTFHELPLLTQHYLGTAKLVPPHARGLNSIEDERSRISLALFRSLKGNDIALVELRHEAAAMSRKQEARASPSAAWNAAAVQRQEARLQEVLGVLLPERELLFNEYLTKFDALIWLDQAGREHYTPEDWQMDRDARLRSILDYTSRALIAMDESVTKRIMAKRHSWRTPRPPFPSSFRPPSTYTEANRTPFNTHTTPVSKEGPDSDGKWPRGRRLSRV